MIAYAQALELLLAEAAVLLPVADELADGRVVPPPLVAKDFDLPRRSVEQPLQDFHRGGLARPVGAKQTKTLADFHGQVNTANGLDRWAGVVPLGETRANDRRFHAAIIAGFSDREVPPQSPARRLF